MPVNALADEGAFGAALVDLLERVLRSDDPLAMQSALDAVQLRPEIVLLGGVRTLDLVTAVLAEGSQPGQVRFARLLLSNRRLAWRFRAALRWLACTAIDRGSIVSDLKGLILLGRDASALAGLQVLGLQLTALVLAAVYFYGIYLASLEVSQYLADTGVSLFMQGSEKLSFFPADSGDRAARFVFVGMLVGIPSLLLTRLTTAGYWIAKSAMRRGLCLFAFAVSARYLIMVPVLSDTPARSLAILTERLASLLLVATPIALWAAAVLAVRSVRVHTEQQEHRPATTNGAGHSGPVDVMFPPSLQDVHGQPDRATPPTTAGYFMIMLRQVRRGVSETRALPWRRILAMLLLVAAAVAAASFHWGFRYGSPIVLCAATLLTILYYVVWRPARQFRRIKHDFRHAVRGLRDDYDRGIDRLLGVIGDRRVAKRYRLAYVNLLETEVRWDHTLLERCRHLAAWHGCPDASRTALLKAISRKSWDVAQDCNPTWSSESLQSLYADSRRAHDERFPVDK